MPLFFNSPPSFFLGAMKAVIQNYRNGDLSVIESPPPCLLPGGILVQTSVSLVSAGTERSMVEMARKNLLGKARERPDLVRQVLEKVRRDGILATVEAVRNRLDAPVPLGYSSAGLVIAAGDGVEKLRSGDRVACAGAGYASHAEVVFVPQNLAVRLPDTVDPESAAFTTLGAVALQGLRLAEVQIGETVAVIGLGLIGLITVQLAKAAGCRVLGMDPNPERCRLAQQLGCDLTANEEAQFALHSGPFTSGRGADAVLITASCKSNDPVVLAGEVARNKGIVVTVGAVGLGIPRKSYYEKELTFRVSRSYGPGRYDPEYEGKGRDYPYAYVRWTENRNMQAFVQLMAEGKVRVKTLITHRFPIEDAVQAYELILGKKEESFLGVLLIYPGQSTPEAKTFYQSSDIVVSSRPSVLDPRCSILKPVTVGLLGAGQFATSTLLPAMKKVTGIEFMGVCAASGISAAHAAKKFGFRFATTDEKEIIQNPEINTVVIATRHHLHARQIIAALRAGKNVFVEKPLCLNERELQEIVAVYNLLLTTHSEFKGPSAPLLPRGSNLEPRAPLLMVGFNRRFAPLARSLKDFLSKVEEPLAMHYRVNAGYISPDHWVHDPEQGGGRIVGEVCHFVDFLTFLAGSLPQQIYSRTLPNNSLYRNDNLSTNIEFKNGSLGTVTYVANGDRRFPKERVEVFGGGAVAILDNFRRLELMQAGRRQVCRSWLRQDKGHQGEWLAFSEAVQAWTAAPISFEETAYSSLTTFKILESLRLGKPVKVYESLASKESENCRSTSL